MNSNTLLLNSSAKVDIKLEMQYFTFFKSSKDECFFVKILWNSMKLCTKVIDQEEGFNDYNV